MVDKIKKTDIIANDIINSKFIKQIPKEEFKKNDLKKESKTFKPLLKDLNIDEFYTKFDNKQRKYNKFINYIIPEKDFNYMADLIIMPKTSDGYKYLLVVMDLATHLFDLQPMKTKTAEATLNAYKDIIKRKILMIPEISLQTDGGTEFKGVFNDFLLKNKIYHKVAYPYNHKQQAPVEGLNNIITRILLNYINNKSEKLDKDYNNWTDILPELRKMLNKYREIDLNKLKKYQDTKYFNPKIVEEQPEFKIGDYVHYKLFQPHDIRGKPINDTKRRNGDRVLSIDTRKIIKILYYADEPYFRYVLQDLPHISFSKYDLKLSKTKHNTFLVKSIIGKKVYRGKTYYLVWFKGYKKAEATWEPVDVLLDDNLEDYIKEYEKLKRKKSK